VTLEPGSLLHTAVKFAQVALPIAALAYGAVQVAAVVRKHTRGR